MEQEYASERRGTVGNPGSTESNWAVVRGEAGRVL